MREGGIETLTKRQRKRGEERDQAGVEGKMVIMGLYEIMCVKFLKNHKALQNLKTVSSN